MCAVALLTGLLSRIESKQSLSGRGTLPRFHTIGGPARPSSRWSDS